MAAGEASGGSPGDPYATSKANLRDTIKWLAGIFGGLAAVVIAGTPLSGIGALQKDTPQFWVAGVMLVVGFVCICFTILLALRLLRSDLLYPSDIDPRVDVSTKTNKAELVQIRDDIELHKSDLLSGYASMIDFLTKRDAADAFAEELGEKLIKAAAADPVDEQALEAAQSSYDQQIGVLGEFNTMHKGLLAYASYQRFYMRLQRATPQLFGLAVAALLSLLAFTILAKEPKSDKPPAVVVVSVGSPNPIAPPVTSLDDDVGSILFETGSAQVPIAQMRAIEKVRNLMLARPGTSVLLMARTDTVGSAEVNAQIARRRAVAVRQLLTSPGGIAAARVFVAELPKSDLPNVTSDQRESAVNRTVTMHILSFAQKH